MKGSKLTAKQPTKMNRKNRANQRQNRQQIPSILPNNKGTGFDNFTNCCTPEARNFAGFSGVGALRRVLTTIDDFTAEPTWKEQQLTSFRYIPYLSYDNYLLNELREIALHSPTNASILRQKQRLVGGDGLKLTAEKAMLTGKERKVDEATIQKVEDYLAEVNPEGENIEQLKNAVIADLIDTGNAFIHMIKTKGIVTLVQYHVPMKNVRFVKMDLGQRKPSKVGVSRYFDSTPAMVAPEYVEEYPLYPNFGTPTGFNGQPLANTPEGEHCILHIYEKHPDFDYWGVPSYISGKLAAQSEYKINKFNNSQLDNGFMPSGIMQFFGNASKEEAQNVLDRFREQYTGTGNNSRLVAQFIADPELAAKYIQLSQTYEGQFLDMFDLSQRQIIIAHEWFPAMAGMAISGQLGNIQQLKIEFEILKNTVIRDYQNILRRQWFAPMLKTAGELQKQDWKGLNLEILPCSVLGFIAEFNADAAMTINEKRENLNLPPIADGDKIETNANNLTIR